MWSSNSGSDKIVDYNDPDPDPDPKGGNYSPGFDPSNDYEPEPDGPGPGSED